MPFSTLRYPIFNALNRIFYYAVNSYVIQFHNLFQENYLFVNNFIIEFVNNFIIKLNSLNKY